MPQCLKCGTELTVNEEGVAPVLCDNCAGVATKRARRSMSAVGTMGQFPVTTALLAINTAVFVGMLFTGGFSVANTMRWGANVGPLTVGGEYWRLVTAGFIHGGFFHFAFNMWCLWSLGRLAERLFGRWQTFVIYVLTGVGGSLLSIAYDPMRSEVGASGAIFGIAGALLAGLKFGDLDVSPGERKAVISSMIFFVVVNFALGAGTFGFGANTDNMCHLGGFVAGLLVGLPLAAFARNRKSLQAGTLLVTVLILSAAGAELVKKDGARGFAIRVGVALQQKDFPKAIRLLKTYVAANPDDDTALVALGAAYEGDHQRDRAIATYEQALKVNPDSLDAKNALAQIRAGGTPEK
jgi:membrane associated rhomboid family serine protease